MVLVVGHHRGEAQPGIHAVAIRRQQRHPAQQAVGVGRGVEKSGSTSGLREQRQTADDAAGFKERIFERVVATPDDGEPERVLHARGRLRRGRIESQRVPDHDPAFAERLRENMVRGFAAAVVPVGFREDDVECDGRGAEIAQRRQPGGR